MSVDSIFNLEPERPLSNEEDSTPPVFLSFKNTPLGYRDTSGVNFLINESIREVSGDNSLAAAPLQNSLVQLNNDSNVGFNMECPEVVNKKKEDEIQNLNIEKLQNLGDSDNNGFDWINKPFPYPLVFNYEDKNERENENNLTDSNINFLENKDAPLNILSINDSIAKNNFYINSIDKIKKEKLNTINKNEIINKDFSKPNDSLNKIIINNDKKRISKRNKKCNEQEKNNKNIYTNNQNKELKNIKLKVKKLRKFKTDCIRKKIKSRFHKKFRNFLNSKLKEAGSNMYFELLPQPFITNIRINFNKKYLNKTIKELFKEDICCTKIKDRDKADTNKRVLEYLENNPNILDKSNISDILNSSYENILEEYFYSNNFSEDVEMLKKEGESPDYIIKYKYIGEHWIDFFKNDGIIDREFY